MKTKISRKKFIIGAVVWLVLLISVVAVINAGQPTSKTASSTESQSKNPATQSSPAKTTPVPHYTVAHRDTRAMDKADHLYVVIDPVDTSSDAFKATIKAVVKDLATRKGYAEFSANIYDNADIAAYYYNNLAYDTIPTGDQQRAMAAQQAQHLIADYIGGYDIDNLKVSTAPSAYQLDYFPAASTDTPTIGRFVGHAQFKP